jgi:hypothetical protein
MSIENTILIRRSDLADVGIPGAPLMVQRGLPNPTPVGGSVTAPGIGAVIADTGALPAGTYRVEVSAGFSDTVVAGKGLTIEHRDAANTATVRTLGHVPAASGASIAIERLVLALNERVRVINAGVAGAAGSVAIASIRAYVLPS